MFRESQQIGSYTLIRKLGKGGFGEVWLAEKRSQFVTKKVAVKLPLDEQVDLDAIRQEAELWEQASGHANVLPIIDADIIDEQVVIVSEYAEGGSLADKLKRDGKFPVKQAVEMTIGILNGLEYLHNKRIIHRDIKPQNILLQNDTPRLADFGISRAMQTNAISSTIIGTDAYMSPESFDSKRSVQTDIWSVGVVLYQLLSEKLPFPQEHPTERMFAILTKDFVPLAKDIPPDLRRIIEKSLAKLPENRYQTTGEMREDLRQSLQGNSEKTLKISSYQVPPTQSSTKIDESVLDKSDSIVTDIKVPLIASTSYEIPQTKESSPTKPSNEIIIEGKAFENKMDGHVESSAIESTTTEPTFEYIGFKGMLHLTKENPWQPSAIFIWGIIGAVSGLATGFYFANQQYRSLLESLFMGIFLVLQVYLFGKFSFSPSIDRKTWSLPVFMILSIIGYFTAISFSYNFLFSYNYQSEQSFGFLLFGLIWGSFIILAELICWNFEINKAIYAIFMVLAISSSFYLANYFIDPRYVGFQFLIVLPFILLAHAITFSKNIKWLISGSLILLFTVIIIFALPKSNDSQKTKPNADRKF